MGGLIGKIRGWWLAASPSQRLTTLGGGALTLVLIALVSSFAMKPKYTMLFGGLSTADQAAVVGEVQAMGVPVQYDTTGTVEVPEGKAAEVRMRLSTAGKLPKSSHPGVGDLSAMNLYTTPAVERERLKSILEGELSRSIETTPGIGSARVHLTLGDPSPFGDRRREATASINVVQAGSGSLSGDQSRGIAMLVANAVDGLTLKNVVVLNERMEPLFNGDDATGTENAATKKLDLEREVGKTEERKLQSALDTMFGTGSTLVTVRCEVDLDEEDSTVNSHKVKEGIEVESAEEKMSGEGGTPPSSAAGFSSNGGSRAPAGPASKTSEVYGNKGKRYEPSYLDTVVRKKKATGGMRRMLINVAANTGRFEDPAEGDAFVASVRSFVTNEMSNQADKTSFQALVTPVKFDPTDLAKAEEAQKSSDALAKRQQMISLLPIAALLIVGFLVVRTIGKFARPTTMMTSEGIPITIGPGGFATLGEPTRPNPALAGGTGLVPASPLEAAFAEFGPDGTRRTGEEGGFEFESDDERVRISKIKERTSIPLEQIRRMSIDHPDAVAMLVKSWLQETPRT